LLRLRGDALIRFFVDLRSEELHRRLSGHRKYREGKGPIFCFIDRMPFSDISTRSALLAASAIMFSLPCKDNSVKRAWLY